MSYQDFQEKIYSCLIKYKKESLNVNDKGTSAHGVEHDCLLPKPYCYAKIPVMLYDGIKETVKDIQASKFAYKAHLSASVHVASSQTACINLFVPILESEYADQILIGAGVVPKDFDHIDRNQLRKGYCFEYWESTLEGTKGLLGDHSPNAGTDSDVAIFASRYTGAATDTGRGIHGHVGFMLRNRNRVGIRHTARGGAYVASSLYDFVESGTVHHEVADDRERLGAPGFYPDVVAIMELAHV